MIVGSYSRYSTDMQSRASIPDQERNADEAAARNRLPAISVRYRDAEVSGSRRDRTDYQRALLDAAAGRLHVLVLDELSRLSRSADLPQVLERMDYYGVRVLTSDGFDSSQEGSEVRAWVDGMMSHQDLKKIRHRTHRGLRGKAEAGQSAGGLPYGYTVTTTGKRAIREDQAMIVRRIFADYLAGQSARQIAVALNTEGVPSSRGSTWAVSAIYGDVKRGIGILANPIYTGRQVWNRSAWVKHPDSGRRIRRERPAAEWVITDQPDLAIVDRRTWDAVQAAIQRRSQVHSGKGRKPRALLSGLLRCGECGGPVVMVDSHSYGCSTAKDRGTCRNRQRVKARDADTAMVAGVRDALLTEDAMKAWQQAIARAMKAHAGSGTDARRKLAHAQQERDNIMQAIRAGIITPSTKAALESAEAAVAAAERAAKEPTRLMPDVRARLRKIADTLADRAKQVPAAREALRALIGEAILRNENGNPVAEIAGSHLAMVAGAGFERWMTQPVRISLAAGREL